MTERLDALLSAMRDGELDANETVELERLLASSETAPRRAGEFEAVDAGLRSLAAAAVSDERLARNLASLARRLERRDELDRRRNARRRILGWSLAGAAAMAAAAGSILFVSAPPARDPGVPDASDVADTPDAAEAELVAVAAVELGTGLGVEPDELASLGLARASDLEVIEELELLEFLAERERGTEEPRG